MKKKQFLLFNYDKYVIYDKINISCVHIHNILTIVFFVLADRHIHETNSKMVHM